VAKKKKGSEPPKDASASANDDTKAFEQALERVHQERTEDRAASSAAINGQPAKAADTVVAMPAMLRDFFAEFDSTTSEFLSLTESELKKQGRAERFSQKKIEDYLTFSLGTEIYGVAISKVREIIKPMQLTHVPRQAEHVRGLLSLRGSIVPVFSLASRLGLEQHDVQRTSRIIVFEDNDELLGFYVDEVREVVRVPLHAVEPPPQWRGSQHQDVIRGVGRVEGHMIILLEFDTLVSHLRAA
jgi:purine-binding chemotaxis protein CheW